jgi:hypothetical protein
LLFSPTILFRPALANFVPLIEKAQKPQQIQMNALIANCQPEDLESNSELKLNICWVWRTPVALPIQIHSRAEAGGDRQKFNIYRLPGLAMEEAGCAGADF